METEKRPEAEKEFWEQQHKVNSRMWLTCSKPESVFAIHGLTLPNPGSRILDIGIGNGAMHFYLGKLGYDVWSADISEAALLKVPSGRGILSHEITGVWDLVICHLVFQHMDIESIERMLSRILLRGSGFESAGTSRYSGVMSFQFAELLTHTNSKWDNHYFRDLETMESLVVRHGFKILFIRNPTDWPWEGDRIRWWVMRIGN